MSAMENVTEARVVVGVDGSEHSIEALRWAARLAPLLDCEIEAVMAWFDPRSSGWSPGWGYLSADLDPQADATTALTDAVDQAFPSEAPQVTRVTEKGSPAKVLLERSADARMLIVGSRGRGGFAGLLLGSVSAKCAEHAKCPVLVVHD